VDIALISASTAVEPLMGNDQAKFDVTKFGWIGSMNQDISFCGVWLAPGLPDSFPAMLKAGGKELIFGSAGPAAISHQHPLILKNVLGANIRVISGYQGQKQVNLAMQRGEVHGACGLFASSIKAQWMPNVKAGQLKLFLQMGPKVSNEFGPVDNVFDFVKSDLRKAFLATMKDAAFLADAKKLNLDIDIATAEDVQRLLAEFVDYPKSVIDKAKTAIGR
jgi:hypothetical protein